jgi:hypothetical protein
MSVIASSAFSVWRDWMNQLLASTRTQMESAAIRHDAMVGASTNHCIFWVKTARGGVESGCLTAMEHSGDIHVGPGVQSFIAFLKKLPKDVREVIIEGIK